MQNQSKFSTKSLVYSGLMGAVLVVGKWALSFIPNVEVVTTLVISFSFVFGYYGTLSTVIFCLADVLLYPPSLDVIISYFIYWNALSITVAFLKKLGVKNFTAYFLVAVTFTATFGVITSFFYCLIFNMLNSFIVYYLSGLIFYAVQLASTTVFMLVGFKPITKLLQSIRQGNYN